MKHIGKPRYGIVDSGLFGLRIISGMVTGIRYTEDKPLYEISFGKSSWWTANITDNTDDIIKMFNLASLERIEETHQLKIKYEQ
jgi:hypothetical protein